MQLPAKQLAWVTGSSGSNPDLSVKIFGQRKFLRHQSERNFATSKIASVVPRYRTDEGKANGT